MKKRGVGRLLKTYLADCFKNSVLKFLHRNSISTLPQIFGHLAFVKKQIYTFKKLQASVRLDIEGLLD